MNPTVIKSAALLFVGFGIGILAANFPRVVAATNASPPDLAHKHFRVAVDEIRQNFVFGEEFTGHYLQSLTLSDGTKRNIELTPMVHDGMQVVELKDTGGLTYMSLSGTTTNGKLMIQVRDVEASQAQLKSEGWATR